MPLRKTDRKFGNWTWVSCGYVVHAANTSYNIDFSRPMTSEARQSMAEGVT
jgi:hypothetical protein